MRLYPSLEKEPAIEQLFSYILHSILMDFHPEDLYIPAINNSPDSELQAIELSLPHNIAKKFADFLNITNTNSYATLTFEIRKRLFSLHQTLINNSDPEIHNLENSFGYLSQ